MIEILGMLSAIYVVGAMLFLAIGTVLGHPAEGLTLGTLWPLLIIALIILVVREYLAED